MKKITFLRHQMKEGALKRFIRSAIQTLQNSDIKHLRQYAILSARGVALPIKQVLALAVELATGREVSRREFSATRARAILERLGFQVVDLWAN